MPRNGSGTYTLPSGNPVEAGTVIEATWANTTLEDIGNELTNSLSRTGEGGMLAPFRLADGTLGAPGIAWLNEPSTGFYRAGAGEMWGVAQGSRVLQYTANGVLVPTGKTFTAQGNVTVGGTLAITGAVTFSGALDVAGNFAVATNKFTVAAASGNTAVAGTLGVSGAATLSSTLGVTGAATLSSTLAVTGAITATGGVLGNVTGDVTGNVSGNAGTVTNGVYTTGNQTIAGVKTFSSTISGSIDGNAATATSATSAGTATNLSGGSVAATTGTFSSTLAVTGATTLTGALAANGGTTTTNLTASGDLTLSGTAKRILGDFSSNATVGNRVMFQSSTTNGVTLVSAIPNGTGNTSRWLAYNGSDPANANAAVLSSLSTDIRLASVANGTASALPLTFYMGTTEAARFDTSGNLGIGTSSPGYKLDVSVSTNTIAQQWQGAGTNFTLRLKSGNGATQSSSVYRLYMDYLNGSNINGYIDFYRGGSGNDGYLVFGTAGSDRMTLDSSGNLGLGVTPSAWSQGKAFEMFAAGYGLWNGSGTPSSMYMLANAYYNSGFKYASSSQASHYYQYQGAHVWSTAPSGTAGNAITFTQAMTLDASGNLSVGTTSTPTGQSSNNRVIQIYGAGTANRAQIHLCNSDTGETASDGTFITVDTNKNFFITNAESANIIFENAGSERARIDSSGNLLVGTTSNASYGGHMLVKNVQDGNAVTIRNSTTTNPYGPIIEFSAAAPNDATRYFMSCQDSVGIRVVIRSNGGIANYQANDVNLSDRREKTNFAPAKSYLDVICAIPVQTFNYVDQNLEEDPGKTLGVVAQDVEAVAPELVHESNWGTADEPKMRLSIYQTDLQYALMKCIQELKAEVDSLKAQLESK